MRVAAIEFQMCLPVTFERDGEWVLAKCETLDVVSQGRSDDEARANIIEALQLFVETCFEMGTLDEVLQRSGFSPQPSGQMHREQGDYVHVPFSLIAARNAENRPY